MIYTPAIIALLFKLFLLHYGKSVFKESKSVLVLLVVMIATGVVELMSFRYADSPESFVVFLRIYYVSLMTMLVFLLHLALLTVYTKLSYKISIISFGTAGLMCYLTLFTDILIAGSQSIGYSVTRVPGDFYWVIPLYGLLMILCSLGILILGYIKASSPVAQVQVFYVLIAAVCLVLPILIVIPLMALDIKVNATVIFPIGNTLFLWIITYAIKNNKLFDIRFWMPFSARYQLYKATKEIFMLRKDGQEMTTKEYRAAFEKIYMLRMLQTYKGMSQAKLAKIMDMSESSVSKKRKEYEI